MQSKDYTTLKRYWNLNGLGLITLATSKDLRHFLNFHSIRDILTEREIFCWQKIRVPKRKKEWLLGRYTAKLLLQSYLQKDYNNEILLTDVELLSKPNTKPELEIQGKHIVNTDLSLSHTANIAVAAITTKENFKVGVDIEKTRKLDEKVCKYFLSDVELAQIKNNPLEKDRLITILWTLKEATLKALRIGLNGSLKGITIDISDQSLSHIRISRYNVLKPMQNKPVEIYGYYKIIDDYNVATVLLEN